MLTKSARESFNWVLKAGYFWNFGVNLNFKKGKVALLTWLDFLFFVPLVNLGTCLLYHQENFGEKILKNRFLHANKIA